MDEIGNVLQRDPLPRRDGEILCRVQSQVRDLVITNEPLFLFFSLSDDLKFLSICTLRERRCHKTHLALRV